MIKTDRIFQLFLLIHVLAWTLAPALVRFNLPMDAMEGATWGHQLAFGYDKNPFLNAWLTRLAVSLGGPWMVYLFSQLSVAACFWAIWQLGKKILSPLYALLGVMMLEGLQYYNFHAIDFNDNTLELGLWALLILTFWQAVTHQKIRDWLLVGLFAGLGMMAKYYTVMLLIPLFLFLLTSEKTRKLFAARGFYCAFLVFIVIIAPHVCWLFRYGFTTVNYAVARVNAEPAWQNHLFFPLQFLWQQCEVLLPGLLLLVPFCFGKAKPVLARAIWPNRFDTRFLLFVGLGPLAGTVLLSLLTGIKLRAGWGQPLLSCSGLLLLAAWRPAITLSRLKYFLSLFLIYFILAVSGYSVAMMRGDSPSSANFPGKMLTSIVSQQWVARYHQPLAYVVGPRWLAGNIAFYSSDYPAVFMEADSSVSPWIDKKELRAHGAVFIWERDDYVFAETMRQRFPYLGPALVFHLPWCRNASLAPITVSVAFLPPVNAKPRHDIR